MPSREERRWNHYRADKEMRTLPKEVTKQLKRNRKPKRVRHKDWTSYRFDDADALGDIDLPQDERVMPRGERERRRTNLALAQKEPENIEEVYRSISFEQ